MTEFDKIWHFPTDETSTIKFKDAITLKCWLKADDSRLSRIILGSKAGHQGSEIEMRMLEQLVVQKNESLNDAAHFLKILSIVVERGNQNKLFEVCPPRIPLIRKKPKSPFTQDTNKNLRRFRKWNKCLYSCIENKVELDLKEKMGRALVSSIIYGCLLDKRLLEALLDHMDTPPMLVGHKIFYSFSLPWKKTENQEFRRWSPDPLSELLLYQLQGKLKKDTFSWGKNPVDSAIQAFFKVCQIKVEERPNNLNELLNATQLWHHTWLPSFLVPFSTRSHISHSLKNSSWYRIWGIKDEPQIKEEYTLKVNDIDFSNDNLPIEEYHLDWFDDIRIALRSSDKKIAHQRLKELLITHNSNQFSTPYLFTGWAKFMIHNGSAAGNKLKLSTIRGYFGSVGSRIIGQMGLADITTLSNDAIEEIYQQVLDDAQSSHHRHNLAYALREFHHYLTMEYSADTMKEGEVLGIGKELTAVDANILNIEEYKQILEEFNQADLVVHHPDMPKIARLVFILAFRCGLRRMESLRLELSDLHIKAPEELLIRPHFHRRLKTKSSVRKLPLYALLTKEEITELRDWFFYRKNQIQVSNEYPFLFSIPEMNYQCVPEETLFPIIHRTMRKVTGDQNIRFHNLRHSFASWTLLRLMIADHLSNENLFSELPETRKFLNQSLEFKNKLYGNDRKTRKHLYAVASLLGHSAPDITLEHYVHFCDLILSELTQKSATLINRQIFINLTGTPPSTTARWYQHGDFGKALEKHRETVIEQGILIEPGAKYSHQKFSKSKIEDSSFVLDRVWKCIYLRTARKFEYDDLSARFGFSEKQIKTMEKRAKEISKLTDSGRNSSHRHRLHTQVLDLTKPDNKTTLPIPRLPGKSELFFLVAQIGSNLISELQNNQRITSQVLEYYINNAWLTDNNLIFRNPESPEQALQYLNFLTKLGIKKKEIQFTLYDPKKRSKIAATWKKAIGQNWMVNIRKNKPTNNKSTASMKWLGIRPVFSHKGDKEAETSPAFRYLIVCSAIYLTIIPPS